MSFIKSLENRRTIYALGRNVQDEAKVIETIKEAVRFSPTAFNSVYYICHICFISCRDMLKN